MFDIETLSKTAKGREEMADRRHGLPWRLRTALIVIDGKTPWRALKPMLAPVGDPDMLVQQLREAGMIESDLDLPPLPIIPPLTESPAFRSSK